MKKYIIYIDYVNSFSYDYTIIKAKDDFDALAQADRLFNENITYLVRLFKKSGKVEKAESGYKKVEYTAVMCKRSHEGGWHENTEKYSEQEHKCHLYYNRYTEFVD